VGVLLAWCVLAPLAHRAHQGRATSPAFSRRSLLPRAAHVNACVEGIPERANAVKEMACRRQAIAERGNAVRETMPIERANTDTETARPK
jgi:hypothetical protein